MKQEDYRVPYDYDRVTETREWINKIPYLKFHSSHEVRVIPPFAGVTINWNTIRFNVKHKDKAVSVYLDCYNNLGYMDEPYWEVYPIQGDAFRCLLNETDKLLNAIKEEIGYEQ